MGDGDAGDPGGDGRAGSDGGGDDGRDAGGSDAPTSACLAPESPFAWPPAAPVAVTASPDWKGEISYAEPLFAVGDYDEPRWIKFTVFLRDPTKVYFQNSQKHRFHYDFAKARLDPLAGKSREEFDRLALQRDGQEVVLGAVVFAPSASGKVEHGIQIVGAEPFHPELVRRIFELVRAQVSGPAGAKALYFPTYEQSSCLGTDRAFFASHGIEVSGADRWSEGNACYAHGWALGRIVALAAAEIPAAYKDGRLAPSDILLTDATPAELPHVAGVITRAPSTPNSHVAILAKANRLPFVHLRAPADLARAEALAGKLALLRADPSPVFANTCVVTIFDAASISETARAELLAKKRPAPIAYAKKATRGALFSPVETIGPADVKFFGGKAANYGLLRLAIPEASQEAIAFSFDLWDGFMAQPVAGGKTLGAEIAARLAPFGGATTDLAALETTLDGVRALVRKEITFSAAQREAIFGAIGAFDPKRNIRFRSSSNVEDDGFTGAGLYDSYSGCVADDTDPDEAGPSACDPTEPEERGALRAIRRTFASFYNLNAFLERRRHGVVEAEVGMALLVHHSVPDALELANGVGAFRREGGERFELVSQPGAASVTNPDGNAQPEVVDVVLSAGAGGRGGAPVGITVRQPSSLSVLGQNVLALPGEYEALGRLFQKAATQYVAATGAREPFLLDFEYKKVARAGGAALEVKQMRRLPLATAPEPVFLLREPVRLCTFQGEHGNVFGIHRLKSRWTLDGRAGWLGPTGLEAGVVERAAVDFVAGGKVVRLDGAPASFPGHAREVAPPLVGEAFVPAGGDGRTWRLRVAAVTEVVPPRSPIAALGDWTSTAAATYPSPVPVPPLSPDAAFETTTSDEVRLVRCTDELPLPEGQTEVTKSHDGPGGVNVTAVYYFPPHPRGPTAGYTAPLIKWKETRITGLTDAPIVLTGYFSQSFRPAHHNFGADYLFEPRLEAGISDATLAQLAAKDIVAIYLRASYDQVTSRAPSFRYMGANGVWRTTP